MKIIYVFLSLWFIQGCNSENRTNKIPQALSEDSASVMISGDSIIVVNGPNELPEKFVEQDDGYDQESSELLNFVSNFVEAEFYQSRKELIDQSRENGYIISEVSNLGSTLKYSLNFSDMEGFQEFSCVPEMGETNFSFHGNKSAVKLYYDQTRLSQKWDSKQKIENGESSESNRFWPEKNLNIRIVITFLEYGDDCIYTMRRKLILPN